MIRRNPVAEVVVPRKQMSILLHLFPLTKHRGIMAFWDPFQLLYSYCCGSSGLDRLAQTGQNISSFGWPREGLEHSWNRNHRNLWHQELLPHAHNFFASSSHFCIPSVFSPLTDILFSHWSSCTGSDFSNKISNTDKMVFVCYTAPSLTSACPIFNSQM